MISFYNTFLSPLFVKDSFIPLDGGINDVLPSCSPPSFVWVCTFLLLFSYPFIGIDFSAQVVHLHSSGPDFVDVSFFQRASGSLGP